MSAGGAIGVTEPIAGVVYLPPARLRHYVESGVLPRTTLVEALAAAFARHTERVALHTPSGPVTYAALDVRTDRLAAAFLALGLEPLDRVLVQSANHAEVLVALVACFKAGLIPVCTLAAHRESEIGYLGRHTDARLHLVQGDDPKFDLVAFAQRMRPTIPTMTHVVAIGGPARDDVPRTADLVERTRGIEAKVALAAVPRDPFQAAIFQLSGGTTGVPKVIPRMQNDYLLNAQLTAAHLGYGPDDVLFMPMPMTHNASAMCFWLPLLLSGASFAIAADNTAEAWAATFRATPPTVVGMVRALLPRYDQMLGLDASLAREVRLFWSPDASALVRQKYGVLAVPLFGMTEGMNMYTAADDAVEARDETVGRPLSPHDEIRLVEPGTDREVAPGEIGELTVRGPYTIAGYFNTPERNREAFSVDGFYRTGDLMVCRTIGGRPCYAFAGRTKDIVNRGHEKISCEELEQAIVQHADVADCAAVPMPDPVLGERTCVYVVSKPGRGLPTVAQLGDFLQSRGLARFKWPERVEPIAALPLTRVGKLDKAALRDRIAVTLRDEAAARNQETVS